MGGLQAYVTTNQLPSAQITLGWFSIDLIAEGDGELRAGVRPG